MPISISMDICMDMDSFNILNMCLQMFVFNAEKVWLLQAPQAIFLLFLPGIRGEEMCAKSMK